MSRYRVVQGHRWECLEARKHWVLRDAWPEVHLIHYTSPFTGRETGWYAKVDWAPGVFLGNRVRSAMMEVVETLVMKATL